MGLGIGVCSFANSITKEIQRILHSINVKAQANQNQLKTLFTEYIHVHTAVKQLSIVMAAKQITVVVESMITNVSFLPSIRPFQSVT